MPDIWILYFLWEDCAADKFSRLFEEGGAPIGSPGSPPGRKNETEIHKKKLPSVVMQKASRAPEPQRDESMLPMSCALTGKHRFDRMICTVADRMSWTEHRAEQTEWTLKTPWIDDFASRDNMKHRYE